MYYYFVLKIHKENILKTLLSKVLLTNILKLPSQMSLITMVILKCPIKKL